MKSVAVLGLGQFGYQVAVGLTQKGFEVVAVDTDAEIVDDIKELVSQAIVIDSTDEIGMRTTNIDDVDFAIVAIGSNVQSSLLSTALLQRMNINEIYVRVINPLQESILRSMGIKHIISIEKEMGIQVANMLSSKGVGMYVAISERHSIMEIKVPSRFVGKTLSSLNMRAIYKVNIVGIKCREAIINDEGEVTYQVRMTEVPDPDYSLGQDDLLVIAGVDDTLKKFVLLGNKEDV